MTAYLNSHGWMDWPTARSTLGSALGVWLDAATIETKAPLPADLPRTHRILAWSADGTMWRLVLDVDKGLVVVTSLTDRPDPAALGSRAATVETTTDHGWERHTVLGVAPILFLRPEDPA